MESLSLRKEVKVLNWYLYIQANSDLANRGFGCDSESWGEVGWPEHTQSTQAALCREEAKRRGVKHTDLLCVQDDNSTAPATAPLEPRKSAVWVPAVDRGRFYLCLECHITTSFLFNQELIQCRNDDFNFATSAKQWRVLPVNLYFNWFMFHKLYISMQSWQTCSGQSRHDSVIKKTR